MVGNVVIPDASILPVTATPIGESLVEIESASKSSNSKAPHENLPISPVDIPDVAATPATLEPVLTLQEILPV